MSFHFFHVAYSYGLSSTEGALTVPPTKPNLDFAFKEMTMALRQVENLSPSRSFETRTILGGQNDGENKNYWSLVLFHR